MKNAFILAILMGLLVASPKAQEPSTKIIKVSDAATALKIAEPALIKVYGKSKIDEERPLNAVLENGIWRVSGTLCCPDAKGHRDCTVGKCVGGVTQAKIRERDGKILSVTHTM